jgi:hypothetical protein
MAAHGRDNWLFHMDEGEAYDFWVQAEDNNIDTPLAEVARHNFMVFRMMQDYYTYGTTNGGVVLDILATARALISFGGLAHIETVVNIDRWIAEVRSRLQVFEQDRMYVRLFLLVYERDNSIAQQFQAQEIFARFNGGVAFNDEFEAIQNHGYDQFLPLVGGGFWGARQELEEEDICG